MRGGSCFRAREAHRNRIHWTRHTVAPFAEYTLQVYGGHDNPWKGQVPLG